MEYMINYTKEGKILGFAQGTTDLNIELSNAIWFEAQCYNKIIIDGENISFNKVDWRTAEELQKQAEVKAIYDRKYVGIEYTNLNDEVYVVSLTNNDANGLIQVKTAFEFGITETNFKCSNGIVVPINSLEDLIHLGEFVVTERNKFFV